MGCEDYADQFDDFHNLLHETFEQLRTYPLPVVMAGKGAVIGAAFVYALLSDVLIVGADTTLSFPETKQGLFSSYPPALLLHVAGQGVANEVMLVGEPILPERAVELGLAFEVVPEADVDDDEAWELTGTLAGYPPRLSDN